MQINQQICFWELALAITGAVVGVAGVGLSAAQAAGAFDKKEEAPAAGPTADQLQMDKLRRARLGLKQTWLTSPQGVLGSPSVAKPALRSTLG